jgi:ABC-type cobalt transport system substrate-binding protein
MLGHACGKQNNTNNEGDEYAARPWIIHLFHPASGEFRARRFSVQWKYADTRLLYRIDLNRVL